MDVKIGNLANPEIRQKLKYTDGKIALIDELTEVNPRNALQFDGVYVLLCLGGKYTFEINGKQYVGHKNDAVICSPESILSNVLLSPDFRFRCVFISTEYAEKTLPLPAQGWNYRLFIEHNALISLLDSETEGFCRYFDLLKAKFSDNTNVFRDKILDALVQAFVYDFGNVLGRIAGLRPRPMSSAENIFDRFISLLAQSYPKRRDVAYYADRLNITPKYLTVVCKKTGGKTSSKIIDAYVTKDIERLLKSTRKSVKEISNELEFPNTSFFGRYVKKNLGCAPNEFRRRQVPGHS